MMRFGQRLVLAAALVGGAAALTPHSALRRAQSDLAIVAPRDAGQPLSFTELRQVLKGDRQYWNPDLPVVLFVRAPTSAERSAVLDVIYQMSEPQFKQYWIAKQFRAETATSPKNMRSNVLTQQFVASTPGAIGFMAASDVKPGVKILKIEGRLPGEAGYKLHLTARK